MLFVPVKFVFDKNFKHKKEVYGISRSILDIKIIDNHFYTRLFEKYEDDSVELHSSKSYAAIFCPSFEEGDFITIFVTDDNNQNIEDNVIVFDKHTFRNKVEDIVLNTKIQYNHLKLEMGNWKSIFRPKTSYQRKTHAEACFYTGDFKTAEILFKKIIKNYTVYSERMIGMCEYMQHNQTSNMLLFDFFILNDDYNAMYNCIKYCTSEDIKYKISKKLLKMKIDVKKRMLLLYICIKWNLNQKRWKFTDKYKEDMICSIENDRANKNNQMWTVIFSRIQQEIEEAQRNSK